MFYIASCPGLHHLQSLLAYSTQLHVWRRKAREILSSTMMSDGRHTGQCLRKNLMSLPCKMAIQALVAEGNINTACYSVYSGLINAKFVNYNNRALASICLPSVYLV